MCRQARGSEYVMSQEAYESITVRPDDCTPIDVLYKSILNGGLEWVALIRSYGRGSFLEVLRAIPGFNTSRQYCLLITETAAIPLAAVGYDI